MLSEKKYERNCPVCSKLLIYISRGNRDYAEAERRKCPSCAKKGWKPSEELRRLWSEQRKGAGNSFYGRTHTDKTKEKLRRRDYTRYKTEEFRAKMRSVARRGESNPMYGRSLAELLLEKYGEEEGWRRIEDWKAKQSSNSSGENNPMYGRPAPKGSGCGWSGWYKGWYFRSLHELSYVIYTLEPQGLKWESAEQNRLRIPYIDSCGRNRTYTADFLVDNRFLVEIKPDSLQNTGDVIIKLRAAEEFCFKKRLIYQLIGPNLVDGKPFHPGALRKLWETGAVCFTEKYEKRMQVCG